MNYETSGTTQLSPFELAKSLVHDSDSSEEHWRQISDENVRKRTESWLSYFNDKYPKNLLLYSPTIQSILKAAVHDDLFKTQTRHEFEVSLEFYGMLLYIKPNASLVDQDAGELLLRISLIYGKYPGMVLNSLRKGFKQMGDSINSNSLMELFTILFVKYETPWLLLSNLKHLSSFETDVLMNILQGKNPKYHLELPFTISNKGAMILATYLCQTFKWKDEVMHRAAIVAELLAIQQDEEFLHSFLEINRFFSNKLDQFSKHFKFWKSAYSFLSKIDFEQSELGLDEYMDYFIYQTHLQDQAYSLKGRTPKSVARAIHQWHEEAERQENLALINTTWGVPETHTISKGDIKFKLEKIINGEMLFEESKNLKHCAFSYIEDCRLGFTEIWSIKKLEGKKWFHHLTAEIFDGEIYQISGLRNSAPEDFELEIISSWFKRRKQTLTINDHTIRCP